MALSLARMATMGTVLRVFRTQTLELHNRFINYDRVKTDTDGMRIVRSPPTIFSVKIDHPWWSCFKMACWPVYKTKTD